MVVFVSDIVNVNVSILNDQIVFMAEKMDGKEKEIQWSMDGYGERK